ncbi:MAG: zinc-ribbon domain-containing protein [Roseburia sp.]
MDFFDKLGATITSAGKDVSQKAKDLSGTAKLNLDIKAKEDLIQKQYTEIGKLYYAAHKDDAGAEAIEHIKLVREAEQDIARMQDQILQIKGAVKCPQCGAQLPEGTGFCGQCGARITVAASAAAPAQQTSYQSAPAQPTSYQSAPAQPAPAQGEVPFNPSPVEPAQAAPEKTEGQL